MLAQVPRIGEGLGAVRAAIGLLAGVQSPVGGQHALHLEALSAVLAVERALLAMQSGVTTQLVARLEHASAHLAAVGLHWVVATFAGGQLRLLLLFIEGL